MPTSEQNQQISEESKRRKREYRLFYRVLGVCVAVLFLGVFILNLVLPDKQFSESEKRMLAQAPEFSFTSVTSGKFGDDFEEYASDQMLLRTAFVSLKTVVDGLLGKKESQGVYRGKSGTLIQKMNDPDPETIRNSLSAVNAFVEKFPSQYAFVLVPNAVSIYKEKLPACALTADQAAFSKTVWEGLSKSGITYVDLSETLYTEKENSKELLYYRTDHHWTTPAAYACRNAVLQALSKAPKGTWSKLAVTKSFTGSLASKSGFSSGKTDTIYIYTSLESLNYLVSGSSREGKSTSVYSMEGLESSDPYTVFLGGNDGYLHIETDQASAGRLLVFKDSYFNCFLPFLLNEYETIDVVDPRYFSGELRELMYENQYDQVLFFYNMNTFSEDTSLSLVLSEAVGEEGSR